jgi:tetratricopeptide (TPR) repeat protein
LLIVIDQFEEIFRFRQQGIDSEEAAAALLAAGKEAADDGSWENIAVARVWYLAGEKEKARPILAEYGSLSSREETDMYRIGRMHCEAEEYDLAQKYFDRALALEPESDKTLVAMGACAMMAGDRERAEEFFRRALELESENPYRFATIAAAYLGVLPDLN